MVAYSIDNCFFVNRRSPYFWGDVSSGALYIFSFLKNILGMDKRSNNKESVLAVVLLLLLVFQFTRNRYFITGAILYIILALLSEKIAIATDIVWKKVTHFIGVISSAVLFSLLFYLIFFPAGMLLKLFKKGSFIRFSPKLTSTFQARNKLFAKADLEQPF